jgi:glutaconyl-CoA decarboxylase
MAKPVSEQPATLTTVEKPVLLDSKTLTAPMPGKILEIKVKVGDQVEAGQPIVILEAMKMENVMTAPASGIVKEIPIETGINVNQGDILVAIE